MQPHSRLPEKCVYDFDSFVGQSASMRCLYAAIAAAAPNTANIFLSGETGTGKELAALSLHRRSRRADNPFITLNCAALPHDLIESELFGHRRGAFTGAAADHAGAISRADGGTLFLDEITEMPLHLQAKLLRVVETGVYTPLGSGQERRADLRIISASNRAVETARAQGYLRDDLYFRLAGLRLVLPPLRTRGAEDIWRLSIHLLGKISNAESAPLPELTCAAKENLAVHTWPGNVRELENTLRQAAFMRPNPEWIDRADLDIAGCGHSAVVDDILLPLETVERRHIERVVDLCQGSLAVAARHLGVDASTLHRKRQRWQQQDRQSGNEALNVR